MGGGGEDTTCPNNPIVGTRAHVPFAGGVEVGLPSHERHNGTMGPKGWATRGLKNRHNTPSGFTKGIRAPMGMCVASLCMYREDLVETV